MSLPEIPEGIPRIVLILVVPVVAFVVTVGLTLGVHNGDDAKDTAAPPTAVLAVATQPASPTASPQPPAPPLATATAAPVLAEPDRTSCEAVRGTTYRSDAERTWFLANCRIAESAIAVAARPASAAPAVPAAAAASTAAAPAAPSGAYLSGSSDRLVVSRLGINAPVNYRGVGGDGVMGNPAGAYDVVWYDFSSFGGLGGYPGSGGNAVFAGHVDYRGVGPAVFFRLRGVTEGDVIEYHRADGQVVRYSVIWFADVAPTEDFGGYVTAAAGDVITLITCNGEFDFAAREYSHRRVVRAARS